MHNLNAESPAVMRARSLISSDATQGIVRRLVFYVFVTAVFTLIMINYSLQHGRLAIGPTDDDCNYLVDALQRLRILYDSPRHLLVNLVQFPPHSPFATGLALLGFLVFGLHQWAPYACNGLLVLAVLLIVDYLAGPRNREGRIACLIFTLTFAFTANVVTEFRPDCAVGIVTGLGLILMMRGGSPLAASAKKNLVVGGLLALALLIKPPFAPFTLITFGWGWVLSVFLIHGPPDRDQLKPAHVFRQVGWFVLPSIVLALPYFLIHFEVVTYIQNQAFGRNKGAFELKQSGMNALRFYWDGGAGQMMLGRSKYVALLIAIAGMFLLKPSRNNWRLIASYLLLIAISFGIPTFTRMDNPFFATTADVLILLGTVLIISSMLTEARLDAGRRIPLPGVAWTGVALGVLVFHWPTAHYNAGSQWSETVDRIGRQTFEIIRDQPGSRNARVFFTAPGPADDMLFRYNALVNGLTFWCPNRHVSRDPEIFRHEIDAADFVVAAEPGSGLVYDNITSPSLQADALQMARENPNLTELAKLPALHGKAFHIFVRRDLSSDSGRRAVPFEDPWMALYGRE